MASASGHRARAGRLIATALALALVGQGSSEAYWRPRPTTNPWQLPLSGKGDTSLRSPVDNVDGYTNATGFPLTAADQLRFNRWLAREAHKRRLAVGLKNDPGQVRKLARAFDFAVVEQCFQYDECRAFSPFVRKRKAVFEV